MMKRYVMAAGQMRHMSAWKPDQPDPRDLRVPIPPGASLPPRSDLRPVWPRINDQGQIGSCTANGGCEILEYLEHKGVADVPFSRLYLYAKTRQLEGTPLAEDSGAQIRTVLAALARFGVCYESTWTYDRPELRFAVAPSPAAEAEAAQHKALFYYSASNALGVPNLFVIKASIAQGFPIMFGFSVPANFMTADCANTGIVHFPTPDESFSGGHCVVACGYDDGLAIDGVAGAVLCANSWGAGWGQGGFFWMPYKFFTEGLARDAWTLRKAAL